MPLQELCFRAAFPSVERDGVRLAFDHVEWLKRERGIAASSEVNVLAAYIAAAKFTYHAQSSVRPGQSEKAYSDLPVVSELRGMHRDATSRARVAAPVSVEESKWIDWPVYLQLVKALEVDALEAKRTNGKPRTPREVASAMQTYLLFAILASVPDRQRTLRELQLGRTLFKDEGGYVIRHGPDDYKTGESRGCARARANVAKAAVLTRRYRAHRPRTLACIIRRRIRPKTSPAPYRLPHALPGYLAEHSQGCLRAQARIRFHSLQWAASVRARRLPSLHHGFLCVHWAAPQPAPSPAQHRLSPEAFFNFRAGT